MSRDSMQSSNPRPERPVGVTIIAVVAAAGGLLSLFGAASSLAGMGTGPVELAYIVVIFGILGLALGAGFYTGAKWAWMAGIIIYVISIGLEYLRSSMAATWASSEASSQLLLE